MKYNVIEKKYPLMKKTTYYPSSTVQPQWVAFDHVCKLKAM